MQKLRWKDSGGWTSAETLVISGLILVLASISGSAWWGVQRSGMTKDARGDMLALLDAGRRYFDDYGRWPTPKIGKEGDLRYGLGFPNSFLMDILSNQALQDGQPHPMNPDGVVYLKVKPASNGTSGLDAERNFLDPWGSAYQVVVDTDLNNTCEIERSSYGQKVGRGMVIWSKGPDKISDTLDDIVSWRIDGGPEDEETLMPEIPVSD